MVTLVVTGSTRAASAQWSWASASLANSWPSEVFQVVTVCWLEVTWCCLASHQAWASSMVSKVWSGVVPSRVAM